MAFPTSRGNKLTTRDMIQRLSREGIQAFAPEIKVGFGPAGGTKALAARAAAAIVRRTPLRTKAEGFLSRPIAPPKRLALPAGRTIARAAGGTAVAVVGATAAEKGFDILKRNAPQFGKSVFEGLTSGAAQDLAGQLAKGVSQFGPRLPKITKPMGGAVSAHGAGQSISTLPGLGGTLPPRDTVVKVWNTGTAQFARLADGRIAVQKKDGTIKVYRPQKHIVIPRNPRVGTLIRADKRLKRLVKGLKKVVK